MQSTRFPGKVLHPIPLQDGKPMLLWIIDQLKTSSTQGNIIVATSTNSLDDKLEEFCNSHNIDCFRGDEDNVFSRFQKVTVHNQLDIVVRLTADNPLIEIKTIDKAIKYHINESNQYTYTSDLPIGMNVEIVDGAVLQKIEGVFLTKAETEHVTLHIKDSNNFKKERFRSMIDSNVQNYRLTIDYPSDFLVLSSILQFYRADERTGIDLIYYIHKNYPWIFEVNRQNFQRTQHSNINEELNAAINILKVAELERAAKILKEHE